MLVCAAIKLVNLQDNDKLNDSIICGLRHGDCFETLGNFNVKVGLSHIIEGFIDNKGNFLNRKEAFLKAVDCGQLSQTTFEYKVSNGENELFSEDLY